MQKDDRGKSNPRRRGLYALVPGQACFDSGAPRDQVGSSCLGEFIGTFMYGRARILGRRSGRSPAGAIRKKRPGGPGEAQNGTGGIWGWSLGYWKGRWGISIVVERFSTKKLKMYF